MGRGGTYFHFCRQQKRTSLWDNFSAKFSIVCIHCAIKKWLLITYTIYHNLIKCCNFEGLKNEAIFCLYFFNIYSTGLYFLLQVSQKGFAYNLWKLKISFWFEINNATEYRTLKRFWPLRRHLALRKAACAWQKWAANFVCSHWKVERFSWTSFLVMRNFEKGLPHQDTLWNWYQYYFRSPSMILI